MPYKRVFLLVVYGSFLVVARYSKRFRLAYVDDDALERIPEKARIS